MLAGHRHAGCVDGLLRACPRDDAGDAGLVVEAEADGDHVRREVGAQGRQRRQVVLAEEREHLVGQVRRVKRHAVERRDVGGTV